MELPKPVPRANLIDRACGTLTGEPEEVVEERYSSDSIRSATTSYVLAAENAEPFPELLARARTVLSDIQSNHGTDGQVLVVTHPLMVSMLFAAYYNMEWQPVVSMFNFGTDELLELSPETTPEKALLRSQH